MKYFVLMLSLFFGSCPLFGEGDLQFPGLRTIENIGQEIQKSHEIYSSGCGLRYQGRTVVYGFEFITFCRLNVEEQRAILLSLVDSLSDKLSKEPAVAAYFRGSKDCKERLRNSITIRLDVRPHEKVTSREKSAFSACNFRNDTLSFILIDAKNKGAFKCFHTESFEQATEKFSANPILPRLTLSGQPFVAT